jgi:hypothetical protein
MSSMALGWMQSRVQEIKFFWHEKDILGEIIGPSSFHITIFFSENLCRISNFVQHILLQSQQCVQYCINILQLAWFLYISEHYSWTYSDSEKAI